MTTPFNMPEPMAYLWSPRKRPDQQKLAFQEQPSVQLKALGFISHKLYTAEALRDVLEQVLNYYSPDDTVTDYQDKIRAMIKEIK
jgi:hypothetical protein